MLRDGTVIAFGIKLQDNTIITENTFRSNYNKKYIYGHHPVK